MTAAVKLNELFADAPFAADLPALAISDITTHSGRVEAGGLFMACQGYGHHGLEFLAEALAARPAAVAWEPSAVHAEPEIPEGVVGIRVEGLGDQVGAIADRFFGEPSAALRVTGITGTNGKTTSAWLAAGALHLLGRKTAYMGTLGYGIGNRLQPSELTTPGVIAVHRRLRAMADAGARLAVMEVSSHALDQGRVDGVRIRTAAFTNLSRDHLDYHPDFDSYGAAKAKLFDIATLESVVINVGDPFGRQLAAAVADSVELLTVTMQPDAGDARLRGEILSRGPAGFVLRLSGEFGDADLHAAMWGDFNAENLLVAAGIVLAHGFDLQAAVAALEHCAVPPGRMQLIHTEGLPLAVIDFAHTPDALEKALRSVRAHCAGDVWVVFGCGGDRDQGKRAAMGAVAGRFADHVVITSDNPRHENPDDIIAAVRAGVPDGVDVRVEADRRSAILQALQAAGAADAVLIAGKGSEEYQLIGDRREAFSDIVVAGAYLRAPR